MNNVDSKERLRSFLTKKYDGYPQNFASEVILHVTKLYCGFEKHADREFISEFLSGDHAKFHQRYWEMYVFDRLISQNLEVVRKQSGPDFGFKIGGKRVWIEAVAVERGESGEIDAYYAEELRNGGGWFTPDIFYLRLTNAIDSKVEKFKNYIRKVQVFPEDICVIAINTGLLGSLGMVGASDYPSIIDVLFGIGPEFVRIEKTSGKILEQGYSVEPVVMKGASPVSKCFFQKTKTRHISAVLASVATPEKPGFPMFAVHNPHATHPLPLNTIGAETEYYFKPSGEQLIISKNESE